MELLHRAPEQLPNTRAVILIPDGYGYYEGWTGFEFFGLIKSFRYYGWRVTCWAQVMAEFYGQPYRHPFFSRLEQAVGELDRLMNIAEHMGALATAPVRYAGFDLSRPVWKEPDWQAIAATPWYLRAPNPFKTDRMQFVYENNAAY